MYLEKFQDKYGQAKRLEGTINSVVKQFRKSSILYTNVPMQKVDFIVNF